jgi:phosphatidylglycerophosphate synthase
MAGACDMLDGTMAKLGNLQSRFGGILDSCCDRVSDFALYAGAGGYFLLHPGVAADGSPQPNLTLVLLAAMGFLWGFLISYIKARAENVVPSCGGGFWQRGERVVTFLTGLTFCHLTTIVWILGIWPLATVAHRLWRARRACAMGPGASAEAIEALRPQGWLALVLWKWDRRGIPFDIHVGIPILMLALWDIPAADPLREFLAH